MPYKDLPFHLPPDHIRCDAETNCNRYDWTDLQLSSFDDDYDTRTFKRSPTLNPTDIGNAYSRAMAVHARRLGGGHALLTPMLFKTITEPGIQPLTGIVIQPDFVTMGDIGLLWMGTFQRLWGTWTPGHTDDWIWRRHGLRGLSLRTMSLQMYEIETREIDRADLQVLEARLPGTGADKELYARLELAPGADDEIDGGIHVVSSVPTQDLVAFMCESYDIWQKAAYILRAEYEYKHLTGPMEYVLCTGGVSVLRWKTLVSEEMEKGAEYDSSKSPAKNGLRKRVVSYGDADEDLERAWVFVRFSKCLSRKVYQERGKLDQAQRTVVDDVLEYILDTRPDLDMAFAGHGDIDRFLLKASTHPSYAPHITPTTTYPEFSSMLQAGTIRPPVKTCNYMTPRKDFHEGKNAHRLSPGMRDLLTELFAKKVPVGVLPFVYEDA